MPQTKCQPDLIERFCEHILAGLYKQEAAAAVGLARTTVWRWEERGLSAWGDAATVWEGMDEADRPEDELDLLEGDDRNYALFARELGKAEARAVQDAVEIMRKAATEDSPGDWRAAEAYLRMRHPLTWGDRGKQRHEHVGSGGAPITFEVVTFGGDEDAGDGEED